MNRLAYSDITSISTGLCRCVRIWKNGINALLIPAWTERSCASLAVGSWIKPIYKMPLSDSLSECCPNDDETLLTIYGQTRGDRYGR